MSARQTDIDAVEKYLGRGFNKTRIVRPGRIRVDCDQCQVVAINGVPCHETGCPNAARSRRPEVLEDDE